MVAGALELSDKTVGSLRRMAEHRYLFPQAEAFVRGCAVCLAAGAAPFPLAAIPIRFHVEGGPELRAAVAAVAQRLTAALGAAPGNERLQQITSPAGQ